MLFCIPFIPLVSAIPQPAPLTNQTFGERSHTGGLYVDFLLDAFPDDGTWYLRLRLSGQRSTIQSGFRPIHPFLFLLGYNTLLYPSDPARHKSSLRGKNVTITNAENHRRY